MIKSQSSVSEINYPVALGQCLLFSIWKHCSGSSLLKQMTKSARHSNIVGHVPVIVSGCNVWKTFLHVWFQHIGHSQLKRHLLAPFYIWYLFVFMWPFHGAGCESFWWTEVQKREYWHPKCHSAAICILMKRNMEILASSPLATLMLYDIAFI